MAATTVGIVYATASGMLRRIEIPDNDAQLASVFVSSSESLFIAPLDQYNAVGAETLLATQLAVPSLPNPRCAVIDQLNNVVNVICADATIDSIANHTLINHPTVEVGWIASSGVLLPPVQIPSSSITVG